MTPQEPAPTRPDDLFAAFQRASLAADQEREPALPDSHALWQNRLRTVSDAQGRYLVLLAVSGLFFYALDARVSSSGGPVPPLRLPIVDIELSALTIWAAAPTVLGLLLLATLGATEAVRVAAEALKRTLPGTSPPPDLPEEMDLRFNLIDAAVYTRTDAAPILKRLAAITYPALLTLFWVEAGSLLLPLFGRAPQEIFPQIDYARWQGISATVVRALGLVFVVAPAPRLALFWRSRLR